MWTHTNKIQQDDLAGKGNCHQAWTWFYSQNPHCRRKEPTPSNSSLTSTVWCGYPYSHNINKSKCNKSVYRKKNNLDTQTRCGSGLQRTPEFWRQGQKDQLWGQRQPRLHKYLFQEEILGVFSGILSLLFTSGVPVNLPVISWHAIPSAQSVPMCLVTLKMSFFQDMTQVPSHH